MAQLGRKYKDAEDVALVMVSLDRDKTQLEVFARQLRENWTILCDYKGYQSPSVRAYGITGVPSMLFLDGRGRIRKGATLRFNHQDVVADLRLEAFWVKRRGTAPATSKDDGDEPSADSTPAPTKPAKAQARWIFHLKSGGKLKVVSYEEQGGKYALKLTLGSTSISKEAVMAFSMLLTEILTSSSAASG